MSARRTERLFTRWKLADVPADLPVVWADPVQLEQVCNNLLGKRRAKLDPDQGASGSRSGRRSFHYTAVRFWFPNLDRVPALRSPSPAPVDAVVLVIDDEPAIGQVLNAALKARGYVVHVATTATVGLQLASAIEPDVLIVDLGLPDLDGVELCRRLRRWTEVPILVLTVDGAEDRNVEALDAGADDYITKPFSMPELLARVRVAIRHRRAIGHVTESHVLALGALRIDVAAHEATVDGAPLTLTRKEFALLAMLARNEGRVILHRVLLAGVWGGENARVGLLRSHVNQLRRKLSEAGSSLLQIVNEPGVGYRIVLNDEVR